PVAQQRVRGVARQGDRAGVLEGERRLRRRRQGLRAVAALELRQRAVLGQDHVGLGHAQPLQRPAERVGGAHLPVRGRGRRRGRERERRDRHARRPGGAGVRGGGGFRGRRARQRRLRGVGDQRGERRGQDAGGEVTTGLAHWIGTPGG